MKRLFPATCGIRLSASTKRRYGNLPQQQAETAFLPALSTAPTAASKCGHTMRRANTATATLRCFIPSFAEITAAAVKPPAPST